MNNMSLVDFLALTCIILLPCNKHNAVSGCPPDEYDVSGVDCDANVVCRFQVDYPRYLTHGVYRLEDKFRFVLTYVGPILPRRDKGDNDKYCCIMLTFFCPWRRGPDLRTNTKSWREAFDLYPFSDRHLRMMQNMNVLYECREAAHNFAAQRDMHNKPLVPNACDPSVEDELKLPLDISNISVTDLDVLNLLEAMYNKNMSQLTKDRIVDNAKENEFLTLLSFPSQIETYPVVDSLPTFVSSHKLSHQWKDVVLHAKDDAIKHHLNPSSLDNHNQPSTSSRRDHYDVKIVKRD
jgi:hypothetical protein